MERVAVVGCSGAGKTTLARRLGERFDLPVVHLDRAFWQPGWIETPDDEWRSVQRDLLLAPRWIADGNYGSTLDLRLAEADTAIWLDLPRRRCLPRVVLRSVRHHGQELHADGCPEPISLDFYRFVWGFGYAHRPRLVAALARHAATTEVIQLGSPADVDRFLDSLG